MFGSAACIRNKRGMALLITIMVISLLFAVTVQFNRTVRHMFFASAIQLEGQNLLTVARSGLTIAAAILEADGTKNGYDTLQETWAVRDDAAFAALFGRGTLNLEITDYSGMLQVNGVVQASQPRQPPQLAQPAQPPQPAQPAEPGGGEQQEESEVIVNANKDILKRLLLSGTFELESEQQAQEIVDAIVDWIDPDDLESDYGAEDAYYQSLNPPYSCKNGPITEIEELLLVKGITPRLLFGGEGRPGLAEYLTAYGSDGKLNINTAPLLLLQALHPLMTEDLAAVLDEFRRAEENDEQLENVDWYKSADAWPGDIEFLGENISTRSFFFQVRAEARYLDQTRRLTAVVERAENNQIRFLSRKVE